MKRKITGFLPVADALKLCASIKTRGTTLHIDIQNAAMSAIFHANVHRNADVGIRLIASMAAGTRKSTLVLYMVQRGCFVYDGKTKGVVFAENADAIKVEADLYESLSTNLWNEEKTEDDPEAIIEAGKQMKSLLTKLAKAVKAGKVVNWVSDDAFANKLSCEAQATLAPVKA